MKDIISKQQLFPHPISKIWKAISDGAQISSWFIQADFKPEVGYQYTFTHEKTVIKGEVITAKPVTTLVYTWRIEGTEVVTTVSWKLEESGSGTLLTLEHSGISKYPGESAVMMFNNFDGGWASCISNLEKFLTGN